ncbi:Uma2 family endonuclease [Aetokthonos hydrillicola Thurmond2011]|jgi:Uma2 family endonuclease|uniref:Uma2 family endonuclease n=1 Tax=Aetokthonos hydrillicola Thurmond2011 TaxID=2712845 RepID=A0AAP5M714_9CYAN|nr:Uma2 family endonuclease [Aetokthonos hydrillicola]MBO3461106.1 Uma2 family endonuclease [Aetokthonos hydrillicola CCALA 1050]MBW4590673.1 Uma2 family endonuclease [Aetokthonos hydrillicola CCALA 1050]MDR9897651.1 Uma2 family endonuclease [Aetokthonos hydrillicola Thurmond2011]
MTPTLPNLVTFEQFIEWYPSNGVRYELHKRIIVEIPHPTGAHENVVGFLAAQIAFQFLQMGLPFRIPKTALVKIPTNSSTYSPDILVLNHDNLVNEPLWSKQSTVTEASSIPLVVEVVGTNWRDDYYDKFRDYEEMGILEYWIIDYAALGGKRFTGNPKQPTITICELVDGDYQMSVFRGNNLIASPLFPQLSLTAQQIFDSAL